MPEPGPRSGPDGPDAVEPWAAEMFARDLASRALGMELLAARPGVESFRAAHPDVPVWTAAVDETLNDHGYIVPGLGDAGDRIYGTR